MSDFTGFTQAWWMDFLSAWNSSDEDKTPFSKVQRVIIDVRDETSESAILVWNRMGNIESISTVLPTIDYGCPVFSASREAWITFVSGEASAARLVMLGKIKYSGPKIFLLVYGPSFDLLSRIGRPLL